MKLIRWVALLGLALLACDDSTISVQGNQFPAGAEADAIFDAGLVGTWHSIPHDGVPPDELAIRSDDLRTYRLSMRERGEIAALEMTGFVVQVAGANYLNGHLTSRPGLEANGWVLLRYWFELPNRLVVVSLDSTNLSGCDANSAEALYACLRQLAADSKVFADATTYERASLVSTQPDHGVQRIGSAPCLLAHTACRQVSRRPQERGPCAFRFLYPGLPSGASARVSSAHRARSRRPAPTIACRSLAAPQPYGLPGVSSIEATTVSYCPYDELDSRSVRMARSTAIMNPRWYRCDSTGTASSRIRSSSGLI